MNSLRWQLGDGISTPDWFFASGGRSQTSSGLPRDLKLIPCSLIWTSTYGVSPSLMQMIASWIFSHMDIADNNWCFDPCFVGSTTVAAYIRSCRRSVSRSCSSLPSQSSDKSGACIVLRNEKVSEDWLLLPSFEESSSWMTCFVSLYLYVFLIPRYFPSTDFSSAKKSYFSPP